MLCDCLDGLHEAKGLSAWQTLSAGGRADATVKYIVTDHVQNVRNKIPPIETILMVHMIFLSVVYLRLG
jgi:hypothetical protein